MIDLHADLPAGLVDLGHHADVDMAGWRWPHFTPKELRADRAGHSPFAGRVIVDPDFLDLLEALRVRTGVRMPVTSYTRSPEYNDRVAGSGRAGPHTTGRAVDVALYGGGLVVALAAALDMGFNGIGLKQHGPYRDRFIHLDDLPNAMGRARPWPWTYA